MEEIKNKIRNNYWLLLLLSSLRLDMILVTIAKANNI